MMRGAWRAPLRLLLPIRLFRGQSFTELFRAELSEVRRTDTDVWRELPFFLAGSLNCNIRRALVVVGTKDPGECSGEEDGRTSAGTEVVSSVEIKGINASVKVRELPGNDFPVRDESLDFGEMREGGRLLSSHKTVVEGVGNGGETKILVEKSEDTDVKAGHGIETAIEMLPRVMLVGRPNVGKSALFNRLTKRREALVYDTPDGHVTRDFREGVAKLGDLRFRIFDTAGLETGADSESVLARTSGITSALLCNCHLALFLIDGRAGVQPLDAEVGKWLRKHAPHVHVILVLNKAEGIHDEMSGALMASLGEAHCFGFGDPVALSAETGEGLIELFGTLQPLLQHVAAQIAATTESCQGDHKEDDLNSNDKLPLQLAIAGRPNVGKSTLLNALLRQERSLTGPEPGLTRDAVRVKFEYEGRTIYLVDTAGWLHRVQSKQGPSALSAMHARRSIMRANIVALILDGEEIARAKKAMRHSEASLARWVTQEGRGIVVVVNKMDLLKGKEHKELRLKVMKAVPEEIQALLPQVTGVPIVFISALEGKGYAAIMRKVLKSYERWNARLSTACLNNWLQKVLNRHPRRGVGGYGPKVRYLTQVKARPPTFVAFVTGAGELDETDLRFLASALREDFDLAGIPIRILPRYAKSAMKRTHSRGDVKPPFRTLDK